MFHLFDKVYLALDYQTDMRENRVMMSPTHGAKLGDELQQAFSGRVLHSETEYHNFFPGKFVELLHELKAKDLRVVFYCDEASFKDLLACWLCSVFTRMSFDSFRTLMYTLMVRERAVQEFGPSNVVTGPELTFDKEELLRLFGKHHGKHLLTAFAKEHWASVSLEYQIAHYLRTADEQYLAPKVPVFINRYFSKIVLETRRHLILDLFNRAQQKTGKYGVTRLSEMPDPFSVISGFKVLTTDKVKFQKRSVSHLSSEELRDLREDIELFMNEYVGFNMDMTAPALDNLCNANKAPEDFTDPDIDLFLAAIRKVRSESSIISLTDNETINTVAISMFLNASPEFIAGLEFAPESAAA